MNKIKNLIVWLDKKGFEEEAKTLLKTAIPIESFEIPEESGELTDAQKIVRENQEGFTRVFSQIKAPFVVFSTPSDIMEDLGIHMIALGMKIDNDDDAIIRFIDNHFKTIIDDAFEQMLKERRITEDELKIAKQEEFYWLNYVSRFPKEYREKLEKIFDFFKNVKAKIGDDKIGLVWNFKKYTGNFPINFDDPKWIVHDLWHLIEYISIRSSIKGDLSIKSIYTDIEKALYMVPFEIKNYLNFANKINPGVSPKDIDATFFAMCMMGIVPENASDELLEIVRVVRNNTEKILDSFRGNILFMN